MSLIVELQEVVEDVRLFDEGTLVATVAGHRWNIPGHPRILPGEVLRITVARTGETR